MLLKPIVPLQSSSLGDLVPNNPLAQGTTVPEGNNRSIFLSIIPAKTLDRTLALAVVGVSAVLFACVAPFAGMPLAQVPGFVGSYQSALAINDLITAVMLYSQFSILRSRALLLLASGYLFTTVAAIIHALTFPGLFAPIGLLNSGPQTTVWLYMVWHAGFPLLALGYALLKDEDGGAKIRGSARGAIFGSAVTVGAAMFAVTWIVTRRHDVLPTLLYEGHYTSTMIGVVSAVWSLSLAALLILWFRRPHSVLDVWLMVVLCAWLFDIGLSAIVNVARFDLGFYVGRIYGLCAASFVLAVLLVENGVLQTRMFHLLETLGRQATSERYRHSERERLFSAVVESFDDAIVTKSLDGTITGWNPAAEHLFGFTAAEAVGNSIDLIVPADRTTEMHDILSRIGQGERIEHRETVRLRKDGSPVEVLLSISPIKTSSGVIIGASKTVRDITESKRTRQALSQEIEERRRIFETSQDLILVTDPKGVLIQVSPSCQTILGYLPEQMIGHSAIEFIHGDDLESTRGEMRAARRGQHTRNFDSRYVHRDGRIVTLSWMGAWSEPVRRHFFVGRDMTESRLAQETLRESEQLARGIIDTALDAFVQMDENGTICDWNSQAEKIFGWSRSEALGGKLGELIVPEIHRLAHKTGVEHFLRTGEGPILGRRLEIEARRRDGKEIKVELSVTALRRRDGVVFNGFMRDLTDRIAAEDRIRHAEKMEAFGQLTGGIAHDFNNILTVITGTIEILSEAVKKEPQLAAITRMIDEAASRGADLTQHLLAFARKQPLQPRETDVNTLIIDTVKLLRPTLGEQIEIESVFEDEACAATVDPNQLATAILNLALNARDAMPDGGKLILETGSTFLDENYASMHADVRPGRYVLIAVSDTGTGIPVGILDKVFDPFFTSKGPGKGTGLGLSMVYGFVKQSAGHIEIYSEEGHGTTIKMYLPPGTGALPASEASTLPAVQGGHETILVVEDDKLVRGYVLTQLHSLGYVTLDAANGAEALAIVEAGNGFDLLFTDVIMPGTMNGRQLANELKKSKPGLKVLFTSGYTENAIIHHGRLDSGVLLLAKPYRKSDMAGMIRKALAG